MTAVLPPLETYTDSEPIDLLEEDVLFITRRLAGRIDIRRPAVGEGYILNPQAYACVVSLPSGLVLRSRPRIDAKNLFVMLAYAYGMPPESLEETVEFEDLDQVLEFVAAHFAELVEHRLEQGLYRAYVEREENLGVIRGRIAFVEDVRHNAVLRHRTFCRYTELLWDIPENQVLRFVTHVLAGWEFGPATRARLEAIDHRMDEVSRPQFVPSDVDRFQYHRLNADYEPMHRLCRLFLDEMSLSEEQGEEPLNGFLLDMNDLFERFVTEALRREASGGWEVSDQEQNHLGRRPRAGGGYREAIGITPDIVLRRGPLAGAVLDCKFKRTSSGTFKHHDFYQVVSYCTSLGTSRGGLIYPRSELDLAEVDETLIHFSPIAIRRFALNLAVDASALPEEVSRLASDIYSWIGPAKAIPVLHAVG
jgi:5-methylcytosine-specific restriction enzyme subunit McrC